MLNQFQKWIYNLSVLSPIVLVFGVIWYLKCRTWKIPALCVVVFIVFTICFFFLHNYAIKQLETIKADVASVENSDKKVFLYMFTYLLPVAQFAFKERDKVYLIVCCVIAFAGMIILYCLNAILINPIWVIQGYKIYSITSSSGVRYTLISKKNIRSIKEIKYVKRITEYYLVDLGDKNV